MSPYGRGVVTLKSARQTTRVFHGIDFANIGARHGKCWLTDDGAVLTTRFDAPKEAPARTGVDCPFGTSRGFQALLQGDEPGETGDAFKTRATERLMRAHFLDRTLIADWRSRQRTTPDEFEGVAFFNGSSHVQATLRMVIVPGLLYWLTGSLLKDDRLPVLRDARLGRGHAVEAHPRLFLYSAMERIRIGTGQRIPTSTMGVIAQYKSEGADGTRGRRAALELLTSNTAHWLPQGEYRTIAPAAFDEMVANDHAFDAWLSALTAWAHEHSDTWLSAHAGLDEGVVAIEGHILILKPRSGCQVADWQQKT